MNNSFWDRYRSYIGEMSDAPLIFGQFVSLGIIGAALGRNVYFRFQDGKIYPNCWICLIAPSSTFRKTTSLNFGVNLLQKAKPDVLLPPSFSMESLYDILEAQPCGLLVYGEFSELTGLLSRDYAAGARAFLSTLYDCPTVVRRKLRNTSWEIENPVVSMLAATTVDWWMSKKEDLQGGFLPRWLFVPAKTKQDTIAFPPPADIKKQNALVKELQEISKLQGEVVLTDAAKKEYEMWLRKYEATNFGTNGTLNPFISRYAIYALKLAMILEIASSRTLFVGEAAVKEACGFIDWASRELVTLADTEWAFSKWERNRNQVWKIIRETGKNGIRRAALARETRFPARELDNIILQLRESELIDSIYQKQEEGAGRRPLVYFALKDLPPKSIRNTPILAGKENER